MPKDRPNVIIICSDTYRPDHIAANGHPWIKTPELDEFVEKTINFEGGTVSSFPTIPMRTDWLAGRFSHPRHGWRDLDPKAITMPQILSKEGYTTQLIADTTHLLRSKFWQAYDHFHFERGHEGDR
ncbi:MAG: sulfatase-like hydrolase/transferase, partial [Candidatus Latescibacteria bacterium]|nr:sulfatase-like hydrolase/transferase [Candidatus Latescibacterota bacterium]